MLPFLDAATVAKCYAHRPGCRFVAWQEVGIAVFVMEVRVVLLKTQPVPPVDEGPGPTSGHAATAVDRCAATGWDAGGWTLVSAFNSEKVFGASHCQAKRRSRAIV